MSFFTERLRARIRDGIPCHPGCVHKPWFFPVHHRDCEWHNTVQLIYDRERAEEALLTTSPNEANMTPFKNESKTERLVINRKHRTNDEQPANIILLPGQDAVVDESIYEISSYSAPLSEGDVAECERLGISLNPDPPPATPTPVVDPNASTGSPAGSIPPVETGEPPATPIVQTQENSQPVVNEAASPAPTAEVPQVASGASSVETPNDASASAAQP